MASVSASRFPGYEHLYSLGSTGAKRDFVVDIEYRNADPLAVTRGEQSVDRATAQWAMGSNAPGEVVWTRFVGPILLSGPLVGLLRDRGFGGWSTYPVEVRGRKGEVLSPYYGLVVHGRCGPVDTSRGKRVMKEYPGGLFPVMKGIGFSEASWDGSDIFMPSDGTGWTLVTEQVKEALLSKAKNVRLDALVDVEQIV
jgi:hypothetical protein